jgi:polyhydroxyalkanoate synthesis regulator phasin
LSNVYYPDMSRLTEEEKLKYRKEIEELTGRYEELKQELSELKKRRDPAGKDCGGARHARMA